MEQDEDARQKSAFANHRGLLELVWMSRIVWVCMNAVWTLTPLQPSSNSCKWFYQVWKERVVLWLLIISIKFEEHFQHHREVFEWIAYARSWTVLRTEVSYLVMWSNPQVANQTLSGLKKWKSIPLQWILQKSDSFCDQIFIPSFAHSLHVLNMDTRVQWSSDRETAFNCLKECMMITPILPTHSLVLVHSWNEC